jgi:ribosome-associated heat shock protein Hsp15
MGPRIDEVLASSTPPAGGEGLGMVDFEIFPHPDNPNLPQNTMADAERWASGLRGLSYAIDDQTAVKLLDGTVDVVSEGHRRLSLDRVTDSGATEETRIDRWLCAVRLVKTRPLATRLCEGGHVLVNGSAAKPSTKVRAGDRVEAFIADRERVVEVVRPIESRVGAPVAATCYLDHSPPVVTEAGSEVRLIRGEGRPSKRRRRDFERLRRAADA